MRISTKNRQLKRLKRIRDLSLLINQCSVNIYHSIPCIKERYIDIRAKCLIKIIQLTISIESKI